MTSIVMIKRMAEIDKYKYYCKCGNSAIIYPFEKRQKKLCDWCGNYIYANKRE